MNSAEVIWRTKFKQIITPSSQVISVNVTKSRIQQFNNIFAQFKIQNQKMCYRQPIRRGNSVRPVPFRPATLLQPRSTILLGTADDCKKEIKNADQHDWTGLCWCEWVSMVVSFEWDLQFQVFYFLFRSSQPIEISAIFSEPKVLFCLQISTQTQNRYPFCHGFVVENSRAKTHLPIQRRLRNLRFPALYSGPGLQRTSPDFRALIHSRSGLLRQSTSCPREPGLNPLFLRSCVDNLWISGLDWFRSYGAHHNFFVWRRRRHERMEKNVALLECCCCCCLRLWALLAKCTSSPENQQERKSERRTRTLASVLRVYRNSRRRRRQHTLAHSAATATEQWQANDRYSVPRSVRPSRYDPLLVLLFGNPVIPRWCV